MRIALLQAASRAGDVAWNLAQVRRAARSAAVAGARLLVTPEAFTSGYNIGARRIAELAEPIDGPCAGELARIARDHGLAILAGLPERDGRGVYDTSLLVDARGETVASYRKTHLLGDIDLDAFRPGGHLVIAQVEGVRIGLLLCWDVEFPEPVRQLAQAGAHLVAVPTSLMAGAEHVADVVVPSRAAENRVYIAYVNRVGRERDLGYVGRTCLAAPDGTRVAAGARERGLLLADVDPGRVGAPAAGIPAREAPRPRLVAAPAR